MKDGYESDVEESGHSTSTDEDFDMEREKQHENDDSDDEEFMSRHYTADNSIKKRYRLRNSVDTRKKQGASSTPAYGTDKKKETHNSSDSEGESRLQKNFMASDTMPDDPDDDHSTSIRALYGKDEAVYVMDARKLVTWVDISM